jgi:hypothetical protein
VRSRLLLVAAAAIVVAGALAFGLTAIKPSEPRPGQDTKTYATEGQRVSPAKARSLAEYTPLVPQDFPAGFKLATVTYAATGQKDRGNPPSVDVISIDYRRGSDEIVVTTRRTDAYNGSSATDWSDPLHVSTAVTSQPEQITFTGGALEGQSGQLVLEPNELPHVWTAGPELVTTVAGTVDRAELLQVANSLRASVR